jgi:hypothetical protein
LIDKAATVAAEATRCYAFTEIRFNAHTVVRFQKLAWRSLTCAKNRVGWPCAESELIPTADESCPSSYPTPPLPSGWVFCKQALGTGVQKTSPGIVAFSEGAVTLLEIPGDAHVSVHPTSKSIGNATTKQGATSSEVSLYHLTSYEGMGIADMVCLGGCTCTPQRINAHVVATGHGRNSSTFAAHSFSLTLAPDGSCKLALGIVPETSSGSHKFKLHSLIIREKMPSKSVPRTPEMAPLPPL